MKNHYTVLGVSTSATIAEIKRAFRAKAWLHPDLHPGDDETAELFKEITSAYEVLRDPERRAEYDRAQRHTSPPPRPPPRTPAAARPESGFGLGDLLLVGLGLGAAAFLGSRYAPVDDGIGRHRDRRTGRFRKGYFT